MHEADHVEKWPVNLVFDYFYTFYIDPSLITALILRRLLILLSVVALGYVKTDVNEDKSK